jgi:hypothetical protein
MGENTPNDKNYYIAIAFTKWLQNQNIPNVREIDQSFHSKRYQNLDFWYENIVPSGNHGGGWGGSVQAAGRTTETKKSGVNRRDFFLLLSRLTKCHKKSLVLTCNRAKAWTSIIFIRYGVHRDTQRMQNECIFEFFNRYILY